MKYLRAVIAVIFMITVVFLADPAGTDATKDTKTVKDTKKDTKTKDKKETAEEQKTKEKTEGNGFDISIFFTNDTNGHPAAFSFMGADGQGGIPARAALIKKLMTGRNEKYMIVLDTGGIICGRPESNLFDGLPDLEGMNAVKYDAAGVGRSELEKTLFFFNNSINKKATFFFLCSNVVDKKGEPICDKYYVKKVNGVNVGIFALMNQEVESELPADARKDIKILDPIAEAKKMVIELKSKKNNADIIIALTYMGYYPDDSHIGSRTLASSVNGIDIIIDGRTGMMLDKPVMVNTTAICQAYKWGLFLGEIVLTVDDKKITNMQYKLHPVNYKDNGVLVGEKIAEDEKVLKVIDGRISSLDKLLSKPITELKGAKLDPKDSKFAETEIGDIICDAMISYTNADCALQNGGGIEGTAIEPGKITRKSLDGIMKYDNSLMVLNVTGADILKALQYSMSRPGLGSFLQVGGMKFTYSKSSGQLSNVKIKGDLIDLQKVYRVAMSSWLAFGGDGYAMFRDNPSKTDLNIMHREAVYNYLEKIKELKPAKGDRIKIVD